MSSVLVSVLFPAAPVCERRLTLLISAGWVPPDFCASRSCLTLGTDIAAEAAALNVLEGSPPGHRTAGTTDERRHPVRASPLRRWRHLLRNCPNEAGELARDRGGDFGFGLPARDQTPEPCSQPEL